MLDKKEFEQNFNLHYNSLCRYLFLFTSDFTEIEDVVQSVFLKLWEDRETVSNINIKSYLFIAAKNRIINTIRNKRNQRNLLEDFLLNELIQEDADDIVNIDEFYIKVQESVNLLPEKTQIIYRLSREKKLSYKEIAEKQNVSIKTVENQMSSALKRVCNYLRLHYKKALLLIFFILN